MIEISRSLLVNDGIQPELSVDDVWAGLLEMFDLAPVYA